ncbi:MAG TPA: hypothetical protein DDZ81_00140 [Acetobacteraceae bacterium]|jgi:tetratricopeptide (TPR) repeat protein|nr:hypothetical protein [Acetobacteraceae bacterium]
MASDIANGMDLDEALAHHAAGRLTRAEAIYRRILQATPDDVEALNLLGLLLQDQGDLLQGIALITRALEIDPEYPEALTNLARARNARGELDAAIASAERALELDSELPEAHHQLGRALLEQGDYAGAEAALRRSLTLAPELADSHVSLGIAYARQYQADKAIASFAAADRLQPNRPAALIAMGSALAAANQLDAALGYLQRAVTLAPTDAAAHSALAVTHRRRQDPASSAAAARQALALDPNLADVWLLLGADLASMGAFDEAEACQRRALALTPGSAEALRDLAMIGRTDTAGTEVDALRARLHDPEAPESERIAAGFGVGGRLDRAGSFDEAFAAYVTANRLVRDRLLRDGHGFDPAALTLTVDWLTATFDRAAFEHRHVNGDPSPMPVFIVGMPRSGTSLVEQIAASHPAVFGGGERKDIGELVRALDRGPINTPPFAWDAKAAEAIAADHVRRLTILSGGASRFIDKLPDNILMLGHIAMLFPNARVIYCRRDLRDVGLSAFFQHFGDGVPWSCDLRDCASRALEIERLGQHWRDVLPLRMLEVTYEALVADLEGESRRLIDFLNLEWDPACLDFHQTSRVVMSSSYWQVRQPLHDRSVGKWRHYLGHLAPLVLPLVGTVPEMDEKEWRLLTVDTAAAIREARLHEEARRPEAAEQIFGALYREYPDNATVLYECGLFKARYGNLAEGIALLTAATEADPAHAPAHIDLARALLLDGKADEAVAAATQGTEIDPNLVEGWLQLGNAESKLEHHASAVLAFRRASELAPESNTIRMRFARALFEAKAFDESLDAWKQAAEAEPENAEALVGYGTALAQASVFDEALAIAHRAIAVNPETPVLFFQLAWIFFRLQMPARSIELAEQGLKLDPGSVDLLVLRADMLSHTGDFVAAADSYRQALEIDPFSGSASEGLSRLGQDVDRVDFVAKATRRVADASLPTIDRVGVAFALAAAHDKAKDYEAAFHAYETANKLIRSVRATPDATPLLNTLRGLVDWSRTIFTEDTFLDALPLGNASNVPVFIVGMPRSGTTLVEQIIASHPSAIGLGERTDIVNLPAIMNGQKQFAAPAAWDPKAVHRQTAALLDRLRAHDPNALRIINKLPDNIQSLGQIAILFPRAHIIICRRDLRDVCWSCYTQNFFDEGMIWTDTLEECAARARMIEELREFWLNVLPVPVLEVQYETLVNNLEQESRRLIDFVGLPWDPACLSFHKNERPVMTASVWQVRQPIYSSSVGRWKRYRKHLAPLLEGLQGLVPDDD